MGGAAAGARLGVGTLPQQLSEDNQWLHGDTVVSHMYVSAYLVQQQLLCTGNTQDNRRSGMDFRISSLETKAGINSESGGLGKVS